MRRRYDVGARPVFGVCDGAVFLKGTLFNRDGVIDRYRTEDDTLMMPIGAFLIPGSTSVLIDAGFGPHTRGAFAGGALIDELAALDVTPTQIPMVALTHLHADHCGWLATPAGEPIFTIATYVIGRRDFQRCVAAPHDPAAAVETPLPDNIRTALLELAAAGRVAFIDDTAQQIAPGVTAISAPGHTPGHLMVAVTDGAHRLFITGDSVYCPEQLTDLELTVLHDDHPALARHTRERIQRELAVPGTSVVGSHFPHLHATRTPSR